MNRILIFCCGLGAILSCTTADRAVKPQSPKAVTPAALTYLGAPVAFSKGPSEFRLQVLHNSDQESGTEVFEDLPRFMQALETLKDEEPNTLVLSSGDLYIPGPFFNATRGKGDVELANLVGYQASVLGNHEFDLGEKVLSKLIVPKKEFPGVRFPLLSSNLDFSQSVLGALWVENGLTAERPPHRIFPSLILKVGGESVGVVGVTTEDLPQITSISEVGIKDVLENAQQQIDRLIAHGVNKIIVLAHLQQLNREMALAQNLKGADIIIAGGSDSLLAKATDRLRAGHVRKGNYPLLFPGKDGAPVLVVNTSREYTYLGRLVVSFDGKGILTEVGEESGVIATDALMAERYRKQPVPVEVNQVLERIRKRLMALDGQILGRTKHYLNGERHAVRTEETNLGNWTADAYRDAGEKLGAAQGLPEFEGVVSLVNGGGIRASIGDIEPGPDGHRVPPLANPMVNKKDGDISLLDIQNAFRFNNEIKAALISGAELVNWVEHGVAMYAEGVTAGRFPQVSGFRFSFDPSRPGGRRVKSLAVSGVAGHVLVKDFARTDRCNKKFLLVTPTFLAEGGDGYPKLSKVTHTIKLLEQDLMARASAPQGIALGPDTPKAGDERIQNLRFRQETIFQEGP